MYIVGNEEKKQYLYRASGQPNLVSQKKQATQFQTMKSANNALTGLPKRWHIFCLEIIDLDAEPVRAKPNDEKIEQSEAKNIVEEFIAEHGVDELEAKTERLIERYQECLNSLNSVMREMQLLDYESKTFQEALNTTLSDFDKAKEALNHKIEFSNRDKKMNAATGYRLAKELGDINCARRRVKNAKHMFDEAKKAYDNNQYDHTQFHTFVKDTKNKISNKMFSPKVLGEMF